jgi:hypothetical protein
MSVSPARGPATSGDRSLDDGAATLDERCVSCGRPAGTPFCPHCGERRPGDREYSVVHFAHEAAAAVTNTDGTLLRTLWTLVRRPGELTAAYMRGQRVGYMRPLQLFLLLNLIFFLVARWSSVFDTPLLTHMNAALHDEIATRAVNARLATRRITLDEYRVAFDNASGTQAKSLVILMVPMFAAIVGIVNVRRRRYALQHLVFSLHAFSVLFLILLTVAVAVEVPLKWWARARGIDLHWQVTDQTVSSAVILAFGTYAALALRRAYGDGRAAAIAKAAALCVALGLVLFAYRFVLFFTVFWAT